VDDASDFAAVRTAMLDVGIARPAQSALFTMLSGLMWLGNVEFAPHTDNDSTIVSIDCIQAVLS
jgi:myosin-5